MEKISFGRQRTYPSSP